MISVQRDGPCTGQRSIVAWMIHHFLPKPDIKGHWTFFPSANHFWSPVLYCGILQLQGRATWRGSTVNCLRWQPSSYLCQVPDVWIQTFPDVSSPDVWGMPTFWLLSSGSLDFWSRGIPFCSCLCCSWHTKLLNIIPWLLLYTTALGVVFLFNAVTSQH